MDKIGAVSCRNKLKLIILHHFRNMGKKYVFSAVVKSRKKMAFFRANNVTNVMFAVVDFR